MNLVLLQAAGAGQWMNIVMLGGIFVVFFFFFIRPQQKKQKETKTMQDTLKIGDKVITAGGFHANVVSVDATTIVVELARGANATIEKSSITALVPKA
jgi:preprotein translocase subunit YajC